jgi:hypothetical protein
MRLLRVKWRSFLIELPGEILLYLLFKLLQALHNMNV